MFLVAKNIRHAFGSHQVLQDLNLQLEKGQTFSILGRSGCGKTTFLKVLAGLLKAEQGEILLAGENVAGMPPQQRQIIYLYQEALLFPHLDVFENIAFGLRLRKENEARIQEKVTEMLQSLELTGQARKHPSELSGGQKQRVNFGRALIIGPRLLLLDEPFGNLDVETRNRMQALFKKVAHQYQISSIFVTHDLKEALLMGDTIAYMEAGKLQVYESTQAFLADPRTGAQREAEFWKGIGIVHGP